MVMCLDGRMVGRVEKGERTDMVIECGCTLAPKQDYPSRSVRSTRREKSQARMRISGSDSYAVIHA